MRSLTRGLSPILGIAIGTSIVGSAAWGFNSNSPDGGRDIVFTETNAAAGNEILGFARADDGAISLVSKISTNGLGTDGGLGNQGALAFDENRHFLFAVNAGSNDISVLESHGGGTLVLVDKVPSGGSRPISLTVHEDRLYVLNAGGSGAITGFRIVWNGHLQPIANSTLPLSSTAAGAAEISFDREGDILAVTEKATSKIDLYALDGQLPTGPTVFDSVGQTPFGFAFDRRNHLLVSEAFGGAANASSLSSYDVSDEAPSVAVISPSVPTHQSAACWVVVGKYGRYAYATNTGSGSVSVYRIGRDGSLSLLDRSGISASTGAGSGPTDAAISRGGELLFVLAPKVGKLAAFGIQADGHLSDAGSTVAVPASATGLATQ